MAWNKDYSALMSLFGCKDIVAEHPDSPGPAHDHYEEDPDLPPDLSTPTSVPSERGQDSPDQTFELIEENPELPGSAHEHLEKKPDLDLNSSLEYSTEVTIDSNNNHVNNEKTSLKKTYECCGKHYAHASSFRRHQVVCHNTGNGHSCINCKKTFYSKSDLKAHCLTQDEVKHFQCKYCKKEYVTRGCLTSHMKEHTGDFKYICDLCGKGFIYKNSFEGHKATHHNDKPFKCEKCKKTYTYKSSLYRHVCEAETNTELSCDYCGKRFKAKRYLQEHLKAHDDPERFQCSTCGNFFKYRASFYKHKKTTSHIGNLHYKSFYTIFSTDIECHYC